MLRFACRKCGQKMKVPAEYAGKKVRCKGCTEAIRVPSTKQEPVAAASGVDLASGSRTRSDDSFGSSSSSGIDLNALAEMEAKAPVGVVQHDPTKFPEGKQPCPSCGVPCSNEAKLCVQCGYQFEGGRKLQTKKTSAKVASRVNSESSSPTFGAEPAWGTVISGLICIGFGIAAIVLDFDPGEDPDGGFEQVLSWAYSFGGKWVAGGLLGLCGLGAVWWGWQGETGD